MREHGRVSEAANARSFSYLLHRRNLLLQQPLRLERIPQLLLALHDMCRGGKERTRGGKKERKKR